MSTLLTEKEARDLLSDLIRIPSANPGSAEPTPGCGEGPIAEYVADYFRDYPVEVERSEVMPERWNVCVRHPGRADQHEILLTAHLDTVPPGGMEAPFTPRIVQDRLFGRGACDTKGSLAAMMLALRALLDAKVQLGVTVSLLGTADEEYKARGIQHYVASGARPTLAVFGEPTELQIVTAQRGGMIFTITAYGRAAHASKPDAGLNAIYLMNEVVERIRELAERDYGRRAHPLCGSPTLNVGIIEGGTDPWIVPDRCTITVDRRWLPSEDWEMAWREIADAVMSVDGEVEVEYPTWLVHDMDTPEESLVVRCLQDALVQTLGHVTIAGASFTSEAPYLTMTGVPAVIFGPGSILQAHSNDEFVEIPQVAQAARALTEFVIKCDQALETRWRI